MNNKNENDTLKMPNNSDNSKSKQYQPRTNGRWSEYFGWGFSLGDKQNVKYTGHNLVCDINLILI